jgi:hypothetical protein
MNGNTIRSISTILFNKGTKPTEILSDEVKDEWDGVSIEGAHDEEFDSDFDENDAFVPSLGFMSIANSVPSILDNNSNFDSIQNAGKLHSRENNKLEEEPNEDDLLDMGGDPFFLEVEWDGIPIEGAHDEEFEPGSGDVDVFVPSPDFMSMANSVASPIMGEVFDPMRNMGKLHQRGLDADLSEDELLDIGGDPSFLGGDEVLDGEFAKMEFGLDEPNDFEWDGTVDEDAHLDFD